MNDRQLKYIIAIAKEGNLTTAAQKLYISQPSLSSMLAHIEKELGVRLFDRSITPMMLTHAGEQYVKTAEQILAIYSDLKRYMEEASHSVAGRLNIGCGPQVSPMLIPLIIPAFMKRYPEVRINMFEEKKMVLEQKLISGNLDVIFMTSENMENSSLEYISLYKEELVLLAHPAKKINLYKDAELQNGRHVDLKELANEPFVLMKPGHQLREIINKICRDNDFTPTLALETDNWESCLRLTEKGLALTILPDSRWTSFDLKAKKYSFNKKYYRRMFLCYRKAAYHSKILDAFIGCSVSLLNANGEEEK